MDIKRYKKVGVVVAMESEAAPFISPLGLAKLEDKPFPLYKAKDLYFIVCGCGTLPAALAAGYLAVNCGCDCLINFGVCGYTGDENIHGRLFAVNKVYKRDVDCRTLGYARYAYPKDVDHLEPAADERLPALTLFTSDEFIGPASDVPKGVGVDMEGYAVAYAARHFCVDCYLYKSIADATDENVDRSNFDSKLGGAIYGMEDYIKALLSEYLA